MDVNIVKEKLAYYTDVMNNRKNINIDNIVDAKLAAQREAIYASVKAEIDADILKCEHYIELLQSLLEANATSETTTEPVTNTNEENVIQTNEEVNV